MWSSFSLSSETACLQLVCLSWSTDDDDDDHGDGDDVLGRWDRADACLADRERSHKHHQSNGEQQLFITNSRQSYKLKRHMSTGNGREGRGGRRKRRFYCITKCPVTERRETEWEEEEKREKKKRSKGRYQERYLRPVFIALTKLSTSYEPKM